MENGEQKIFVWCDFTQGIEEAILHGFLIASILKKELCLIHLLEVDDENLAQSYSNRLKKIVSELGLLSDPVIIRYLVVKQDLITTLVDLAELYECLALVAHKDIAPVLLPYLQFAAFPFLFVSAKTNIEPIYKNIVVPVGYMKKCKDLALWASYLGRHNSAQINLYVSDDGKGNDQITVKNNLFSIQRFYNKFNFPSQVIQSASPTWKLQKASLAYAFSETNALLIIAGSYHTTFLDSLLGLTELKVIRNSHDLSVMCVNSQLDFYSICN
jgi:hypothetical protein